MIRTLIASALLMTASAASATDPIVYHLSDPPRARVITSDVDLRSTGGRVTIERRIDRAAQVVCKEGQLDDPLLQPMKGYAKCYSLAVASGRSQLEQIAGR